MPRLHRMSIEKRTLLLLKTDATIRTRVSVVTAYRAPPDRVAMLFSKVQFCKHQQGQLQGGLSTSVSDGHRAFYIAPCVVARTAAGYVHVHGKW